MAITFGSVMSSGRETKSLKGYLLKKPGDVFTTEMLDNPNLSYGKSWKTIDSICLG